MICKICHVNQVDTTEGRCRFCFNEQEKIINRTDLPYSCTPSSYDGKGKDTLALAGRIPALAINQRL